MGKRGGENSRENEKGEREEILVGPKYFLPWPTKILSLQFEDI